MIGDNIQREIKQINIKAIGKTSIILIGKLVGYGQVSIIEKLSPNTRIPRTKYKCAFFLKLGLIGLSHIALVYFTGGVSVLILYLHP